MCLPSRATMLSVSADAGEQTFDPLVTAVCSVRLPAGRRDGRPNAASPLTDALAHFPVFG